MSEYIYIYIYNNINRLYICDSSLQGRELLLHAVRHTLELLQAGHLPPTLDRLDRLPVACHELFHQALLLLQSSHSNYNARYMKVKPRPAPCSLARSSKCVPDSASLSSSSRCAWQACSRLSLRHIAIYIL